MTTTKIFIDQHGLDYINVSNLFDPKNEPYFLYTNSDMTKHGYTQIGTGEINHIFYTRDAIQERAIDSLKAQVQEVKAKAEKEVTKLNDKIQQLLAITNEA
jgi:hypothetical protein